MKRQTFRARAFSNFLKSLCPLREDPAARNTYLFVRGDAASARQDLSQALPRPVGHRKTGHAGQRHASSKQNSLDRAVDVLLPSSEPSNLVIVHDVLPLVAKRGGRDLDALADVDGDLLGADTSLRGVVGSAARNDGRKAGEGRTRSRSQIRTGEENERAAHLQQSRFGVLSTSPEQSRRFDPEVSNLLFPPIEQAGLVRCLDDIALGFDDLLLRGGELLLLGLLAFEVVEDGSKVALVEGGDLGAVGLLEAKGAR